METKTFLRKSSLVASLLSAMVVPMLLTGCSDTNELVDANPLDHFNAQGEAYLNITLQMEDNSTVRTRANEATKGENDNGEEPEFRVNSAALFLFKAESERPAPSELTFLRAYRIADNSDEWEATKTYPTEGDATNDPYDVSQSKIRVVKIDNKNISSADKLFAFVMVNNNGALTFLPNGVSIRDLGTSDQLFKTGDSYAKFRDLPFRSIGGPGSFVMTNAPLYDSDHGYVQEMPMLNLNNFYYSEAAAIEAAVAGNASLDVYVERMAAKIVVQLGDGFKGHGDGTTGAEGKYGTLADNEYVRFNMDLTNDEADRGHDDPTKNWPIRWVTGPRTNQCYNIRHVAKHDADTYGYDYLADNFMADHPKTTPAATTNRVLDMTPTDDGLYRIFWAEDMSYDFNEAQRETTVPDPTYMEAGPQIGLPGHFDYEIGKAGYTFENTGNEWGLTQDKTTRIMVRVPFFAGEKVTEYEADGITPKTTEFVKNETFFTIPSNNRDLIYHDLNNTQVTNPSSIQQKIMEIVATTTEYVKWKEDYHVSAQDKDIFNNFNNITMLYPSRLGHEVPNSAGTNLTIGHCTATFEIVATPIAGLTQEAIDAFSKDTEEYEEDGETKTRSINPVSYYLQQAMENLEVACYVDGMAYYKVLVRHFSDDEVNDYVESEGADYDHVYPHTDKTELAKNYLGRYGVVRNTWYTITLDGIKHIGTPDFPTNEPVPDDEVDSYFNTRVNVTKWAQRDQHATM